MREDAYRPPPMLVRFGLGLITLIGVAIVAGAPSWRWVAASTGLVAFMLAGRKLYRDTYGPPPAEVVAYIGEHGIPLVSVEAGNGFVSSNLREMELGELLVQLGHDLSLAFLERVLDVARNLGSNRERVIANPLDQRR